MKHPCGISTIQTNGSFALEESLETVCCGHSITRKRGLFIDTAHFRLPRWLYWAGIMNLPVPDMSVPQTP
ncbi:hypothetical protein OUZ56_010429 [Daphnia magna]|uniref:Uncharacterized protein n=1 Tax=Daphnia magna TaxID=35525 RepID=A0ABR0AII6_9CRUS|nr:hypothetical protein OUZ56_010429 [Daphnia magna]